MAVFHQTLWQKVDVWKRSGLEPFPLHFHGCVEVLYIKKGRAVCSVDFNEYTLSEGDILFVFPDQIHDVISGDECSENYVIFFPKEISVFGEVFENSLPKSAKLEAAADDYVDGLFSKAFKVCHDKSNKYACGEALGYILLLLARLLPRFELESSKGVSNSFERKIIEYCNEHISDNIKLSDMAESMGYAPSYFSDIFSKKFKGGFVKFINTLRIEEAKKMLSTDRAVTDIAYSCGFGSIRTFNRVFKEYTDKTPREYRESL